MLLVSDFENIFRGLGQAATTSLGGVEVVMSMEEIPGGLGSGGLASGAIVPGALGGPSALSGGLLAAAAAAASNTTAGAAGGAGAAGINPMGPTPGMPDGAGNSRQCQFGTDFY